MFVALSGNWRNRCRLVEALVILAVTRALLPIVPFRTLMKTVGRRTREHPERDHHRARAIHVAAAIRRASRAIPCTCLVEAIAGRVMLLRRRVPSEIALGVARGVTDIQAHAWLRAADLPICGEERAPAFSRIARFGDTAPRSQASLRSH
jgi:hypothetical protein